MAKAGGRAGKVVSSGRLTGPVRMGIGKKRVAVRKVSTTSVDSGYSLCSTDSEDQVLVINKGLDRCAALLHDILQHDMRGNSQAHPTQGPVHKVTVKSSSVRGKRNLPKKPGAASHVHKDIGHLTGSLKKSISCNGFGTEKAYPSVNVQTAMVCANPHSPITQPAVCENVPTQMSRLNQLAKQANCQRFPSPSSQLVNEQGIGGTTPFNCRLPSSTPALSPQLPGSASNIGHNQVLPQGGTTHIPSGSYSAVQSPPSVMCYVPEPVQQNPAVPTCYPLAFQADTLPQISNSEKIQESDLLQCIAAHLAQLRCSEAERNQLLSSKSAPIEYESEQPTRETDETSSEEEDAVPARNIGCQTSFDVNKKCSPEKTTRKIKTVKYLLGEIKALVAEQGDGGALRLITELEHNLSLLPAVIGSTNVHAEIALALQPLRSENAQLRRRLRILNQQLRDRERAEKAGRSDEQNFEMISLQSMNVTLQHQLAESQKGLDTLQTKNGELLKVIEAQRDENTKLTQRLLDKEQELVQLHEQSEIAATKGKTDLGETLGKMRSIQFKLESSEKENQILGITLRQRDAEVSRLQELTRTLQASMAKLLCDLSKDSSKLKPGLNLTKSVLDSYEQQLKGDQCLASTSIMSYLKTLETDQVLPIGDATFPDKPEPCNPNSKYYNKYTMSDLSENLIDKMPETLPQTACTPVLSHCPEKLKSKANSVSATTSCDEYKPGDTVYLPLTSSPQKRLVASSQRQMCTPPQAGIEFSDCEVQASIAKQLGYREPEPSKADSGYRMGLVNATGTLEQNLKSDEEVLPMRPHPVPGNHLPIHRLISNLQLQDGNPTDHSMFDFLAGRSDWSMSSFSTFTSHDEQDFRNGLAALDANIARLQRTLQTDISRK